MRSHFLIIVLFKLTVNSRTVVRNSTEKSEHPSVFSKGNVLHNYHVDHHRENDIDTPSQSYSHFFSFTCPHVRDWGGQEKKGMTEDEMVGWHH